MEQNNSQYQKFLDKILKSEGFTSSPNLKKLLLYLTKCSVEEKPPKEIQIAAEVFNIDLSEGSNQDNSIVRVNIHNLRKRLEHYYLTDGTDDKIQFVIPKGRYEVTINTFKSIHQNSFIRYFQKELIIIYTLVIILSSIISVALFQFSNKDVSSNISGSIVWKDFLQNGKKTMIIVGDYFFLNKRDSLSDKTYLVRDYSINSVQDLNHHLEDNPYLASRISQSENTYTGYSMPFVMKELIPIIGNKEFDVSLMSQFNPKYLQDYNIIFVGLYKTMGLLKDFLYQSDFTIDNDSSKITVNDNGQLITYKQEGSSNNFHNDYATAIKLQGPDNNSILLIGSFHDIGVAECAKQLSNPESLKAIENLLDQQNSGSSEFEILFKVIGLNRNDLNSEIIHVKPIHSELSLQN